MRDGQIPSAPERRAPGWLGVVNHLNRALLRRGIGPAPQYLISIPGRVSGVLRTTPVAVVEMSGKRYVVAGFDGSDWVKNARQARHAELRRGRDRQPVTLEEVPVTERAPILREFARRVRGGRSFLTVDADGTDEDFASASPRHPVFQLHSRS